MRIPDARAGAALALALVGLATPATAQADSIVYEKDGNVWLAAPDGTNQRAITAGGGFSKPTQADDGTIIAVKDKLLRRMDRNGRILGAAGDSSGTGPINTHLSPDGTLVAYEFVNTGLATPGRRTALSHSTRETSNDEIFNIGGWGNPVWLGNDRVLMFDASATVTGDTLIYTRGGGTQPWFEDPDLSLAGGEVSADGTRFAATDAATIRLYRLGAPPPALAVEPRCDLTGPNGSFFRPTWSPDARSLAWQEDDGIWVGTFDLDGGACAGGARLVVPGGRAPDWGPANVPAAAPDGGSGPSPGTPAPQPGPGTPATDGKAAALAAKVARRTTRRALLRGLAVQVSCDEPCRVDASLLVDRRTAVRLRLGRKQVRIGRASARTEMAGSARFRLKPTRRARRRLARGPIRAVTVRVDAQDAAGNRSAPITRKVKIRG